MFINTFDENKRDKLLENGFNLICEQNFGFTKCFTFELKPSFYAFFDKEDMKDTFITNEMYI